jgi:hypothetical protein
VDYFVNSVRPRDNLRLSPAGQNYCADLISANSALAANRKLLAWIEIRFCSINAACHVYQHDICLRHKATVNEVQSWTKIQVIDGKPVSISMAMRRTLELVF